MSMDVLLARVALRDRSLLDVVDLSVRFLMRHLSVYARVAAIVLVPMFAATWLIAAYAGWLWGWPCALLLSMFASSPFTILASRLVFEPEVPASSVLKTALFTLPRLLSCRLLQIFAVSFGFLLFVIPGIWAQVLFLFSSEVVVLEQASMSTALGRLQRLLGGNSGDVLMAMLLLLALNLGAVCLGDVVFRAVLEELLQIGAPPSLFETGGCVLGLLGFWLAVPLVATVRLFVYLNLRTRREGWDIQTRFAAMVARGEVGA